MRFQGDVHHGERKRGELIVGRKLKWWKNSYVERSKSKSPPLPKKFHRIFYFNMSLLMGPEMKRMKEAKQTKACYLGSRI